MGLGDNTRATLITRGLAEITRLGTALGADEHTFAGLAGLGDLIASCNSPLARNRAFGEQLGRGLPLTEVLAGTTQTVEGVKSSQSVLELARRHSVEMPMTEVIAAVLHDGLEVGQAAVLLASRSAKPERYGVKGVDARRGAWAARRKRTGGTCERAAQDQGGGRIRRPGPRARRLLHGGREHARVHRPVQVRRGPDRHHPRGRLGPGRRRALPAGHHRRRAALGGGGGRAGAAGGAMGGLERARGRARGGQRAGSHPAPARRR